MLVELDFDRMAMAVVMVMAVALLAALVPPSRPPAAASPKPSLRKSVSPKSGQTGSLITVNLTTNGGLSPTLDASFELIS